jgi:SecD/SecF fusion protein
MKSFKWRIIRQAIPVVLALVIVAMAVQNYQAGQGGFKLGVDLAGGTDLIYEVDTSKFPEGKLPANYKAEDLASALKRRIDPADLYNVTIRPLGLTRVEIILPTGGKHQAEVEQQAWKALLDKVNEQWPIKTYVVEPGHPTRLVAAVNEQHPEVPVEEIQQFIKENSGKAGAEAGKEWDTLVAKVTEKWPPGGYQVARGRLLKLVELVQKQYPNEPVKDIGDFINSNYAGSKEQRHLTSEEVENVKSLISQVGSLEFLVLANDRVDKEAIDAAEAYFKEAARKDSAKGAEYRRELELLASKDQPPPPPTHDGNDVFKTDKGDFRYRWVEIGKSERLSEGLVNPRDDKGNLIESEEEAKKLLMGQKVEHNGVEVKLDHYWFERKGKDDVGAFRRDNWLKVAEARAKGEAIKKPGGILLWSRPVTALNLSDKDREKKFEYYYLAREPEEGKKITGQYLIKAVPGPDEQGRLAVHFGFDNTGADLFGQLTSANRPVREEGFKTHLAVVLDNQIMSAPTINAVIHAEGQISGNYTPTEVDRLVNILRAGALPATLNPKPASENTIGATLGDETIRRGTWSVAIAFVVVLVFMIWYYRFAGIVACIALFANLLLTVAFMVFVNATFTLPGLAGLVLMLGMAVDANVLIYERLREERDRGATLSLAIRNGYDRAFPTIIDTHLSSIFTAIVLYVVGNDQLKGFGISLTAGLVISLFTSLYMTRLMFDIWEATGSRHDLKFVGFPRPYIDFMAIRYYFFAGTAILTILGAALFFNHLDKGGLNIDFVGGTAYSAQLNTPMDSGELQRRLKSADLPDLSIQSIYVPMFVDPQQPGKSRLFSISTSDKDADKVQQRINDLLKDDLKRILVNTDEFDGAKREALLSFTDSSTHQPAFASMGRVRTLLMQHFDQAGLKSISDQFVLEGLGKEEEGRFQWMELKVLAPVDASKLKEVVDATVREYARQPQPERLDKIDSSLAADMRQRAMTAILASWAAILLYLWFRFGSWTFGAAAVICLIHDLFFTLGAIAACHYLTLYLPGVASALLIQDFKIDFASVAALLTLVGYSVNDTIVVFDRIREVRGKNPALTPKTINDSVNQTLSRTILTALTVFLVVSVLYWFGGEGVHLFAFVMVVGVFVGTYSSIYIASPLLLMFGEGKGATPTHVPQTAETAG